jgi:hypothetical protein
MAIVYYPSNASVYTRQVAGGLTEQTIGLTPNTIFVFSTSSMAFTSSYAAGGRSMVLCAAYTPLVTGPDVAEVYVPYSLVDGSSSLSWSIKRLAWRVQVSESVSSSIYIERSTTTGSFSASYVGSLTLNSNSYEAYNTTGSFQYVNSGDKLRFNVIQLGTSTNWTIITEISSVT